MLALHIANSLQGRLDDRERDVRACAAKWWTISDTTLKDYADQVLAVASGIVMGVFQVRGWHRDPAMNDKVVFDLADAPEWQWLVGHASPVTWYKAQANPVRKLGGLVVDQLRAGRPHQQDGGLGWSLDVAPDGRSATVRGPGPIVVTALDRTAARLGVLNVTPTTNRSAEPERATTGRAAIDQATEGGRN